MRYIPSIVAVILVSGAVAFVVSILSHLQQTIAILGK